MHTMHGLWSQPGVPHKGWEFVPPMHDLGEPRFICEMCQHMVIRYVHTMRHPDYPTTLDVGCVCAGNMEEDYVVDSETKTRARDRERTFKAKVWRDKKRREREERERIQLEQWRLQQQRDLEVRQRREHEARQQREAADRVSMTGRELCGVLDMLQGRMRFDFRTEQFLIYLRHCGLRNPGVMTLKGAEWRWLCELGNQARLDEVIEGRIRGRF